MLCFYRNTEFIYTTPVVIEAKKKKKSVLNKQITGLFKFKETAEMNQFNGLIWQIRKLSPKGLNLIQGRSVYVRTDAGIYLLWNSVVLSCSGMSDSAIPWTLAH